MTIVPSIGTVSITWRIASTATWSDLWRSPCPIVCAHAMAACSTTRRNSSERSESIQRLRRSSRLPYGGSSQRVGRSVAIAEQVVGLHQLVNLARAFVDDRALAVAEEAPDRILVRVAVRAVNLHGVAGGLLGRDGGEPFREPGLARVARPVVLHPARRAATAAAPPGSPTPSARSFPSRAGAGRSRRRTSSAPSRTSRWRRGRRGSARSRRRPRCSAPDRARTSRS